MEWIVILLAVLAGLWAMANFGFWGFLAAMGMLIAWGYHRGVKRRGAGEPRASTSSARRGGRLSR